MNKLTSIIIPVYNCENYINRCLDSIIAQTNSNWEAIIIDDGSTDNSKIICEQYAQNDKRLKIIHQKNEGASSARNRGIEMAKGEWITFIDADDYVEKNYLEYLCVNIENEKTLIIQGLKQVNSKGYEIKKIDFEHSTLFGSDIQRAFDEKEIFEYGYTVAKLYNRKIINKHNIRFNKQISYSEDMLFMLEYILYCDSIKFVPGSLYNYVVDASILSQRYNSFKSEYQLFDSYMKLTAQIAQNFSFNIPSKTLRNGGLILMRCLYTLYANHCNKKERITNIKQVRKTHKLFIKEYYKPKLPLFKIIKVALLLNPTLFDIICKVKFR